ncbi:hypothetical protein ACJX0J_006090, partial [Zea mays]
MIFVTKGQVKDALKKCGVVYSLFLLMNPMIYWLKNKWLLVKKDNLQHKHRLNLLPNDRSFRIVHQDEHNPSGAGGFVGKMESSPLLEEATTFCLANDIPIPNMSDVHFYRVDTFYADIDSITTEVACTIKDRLRTFIIHVRRIE